MSRHLVWRFNVAARYARYALSHPVRPILFAFLLYLIFAVSSSSGRAEVRDWTSCMSGAVTPAELIRVGTPITKQVGQDGCDAYAIDLAAGQYLQLVIDKEADLALLIIFYQPDGQKLIEQVSRRYGPLRMSVLVKVPGSYRLEVRSLEKDLTNRRYEVRVEELRSAVGGDDKFAAASQEIL